MQFENIASKFSCLLGLQHEPVAINLVETESEYRHWQPKELSRPLTFCMMVRLATLGYGRKASGVHFRCRGSAEVFRFVETADNDQYGKRLYEFGLYKNLQTAKSVQSAMARLSTECHGVVVQPLSDCTEWPDIVVFFTQAYQAMRMVQSWAYQFGPLDQLSLTGNRGVCSECVARPLATGMMHISPLCANTRYAAKWKDSELGIGVPGPKLPSLLDAFIQTIPVVEPSRRRDAITRRCKENGVEIKIPPGKTYFS